MVEVNVGGSGAVKSDVSRPQSGSCAINNDVPGPQNGSCVINNNVSGPQNGSCAVNSDVLRLQDGACAVNSDVSGPARGFSARRTRSYLAFLTPSKPCANLLIYIYIYTSVIPCISMHGGK